MSFQYRSPATVRRAVRATVNPAFLRCVHTVDVKNYRHVLRIGGQHRLCLGGTCLPRPRRLTCCTVDVTPGLPRWLVRYVGRPARGYRETVITPTGFPRRYGLVVDYQNPSSPHVNEHLEIYVANPRGATFQNPDAILRGIAIPLIRTTR